MVLKTLLSLGADYDSLAMDILDTIDETIAKQEKAVEKNWDGNVDAVRAAVVADILKDMKAKGTMVSRWEADALLKCYHQMYDEPLPEVS